MSKYPSHLSETTSLKRIEGQVRGIQKMIEEGKYCVDILTQVQAVIGALARVEDSILQRHLQHCVSGAIRGKSPSERDKKIKEIMEITKRFRRT